MSDYDLKRKATAPKQAPPQAQAKRLNQGKLRPTLIPPGCLLEVLKVLEMGAQKYGEWNWTKGLSYLSVCDSLERHALAFRSGEDKDQESGLYHAAHIIANALFLLYFQITGRIELDNRSVYGEKGSN